MLSTLLLASLLLAEPSPTIPKPVVPQGTVYIKRIIELDGQVFDTATFDHCLLIFRGKALPIFQNSKFIETRWRFEDAAEVTVTFLRGLVGEKNTEGLLRQFLLSTPQKPEEVSLLKEEKQQ